MTNRFKPWLSGIVLAFLGPYVWLGVTAFRSRLAITSSPPTFMAHLTFDNFAWSYNGQHIVTLFENSFVIAACSTLFGVVIGLPAAYYFARNRSTQARSLFLVVLSTRMAPPIALSLPVFIVFLKIGLLGTYTSVVIAHSLANIGFIVWFLEGIISSLPESIEKSAQVDGRTLIGALISTLVPSMKAPLTAVAGFSFLFSWNEYLMASLLTTSATRPITPALPGFMAQATSQWGDFCAVAMISSTPVLVIAFLGRKFLVRAFAHTEIVEKGLTFL